MRLKQSAISGNSVAAVLVAILGTVLFTTLLCLGKISQVTYGVLLGLLAAVCLVLYGFSRVREIDFKGFRVGLDPVAEIKPASFKNETPDGIEISVSPYYSIVKVKDIEYYFKKETGEFDGWAD